MGTIRKELKRHGGKVMNPALWAVLVYRYGRWANAIRTKPLRWLCSKLYGLLFVGVRLISNINVNREATIGQDLHLIHSGNIWIDPACVLGDRVGLMQDVVLGTNPGRSGAPVLEDDVFVGAGAKILGPVTIGARAVVAANSLVVQDVPPGATAIGVPARILRYRGIGATDSEQQKEDSG